MTQCWTSPGKFERFHKRKQAAAAYHTEKKASRAALAKAKAKVGA